MNPALFEREPEENWLSRRLGRSLGLSAFCLWFSRFVLTFLIGFCLIILSYSIFASIILIKSEWDSEHIISDGFAVLSKDYISHAVKENFAVAIKPYWSDASGADLDVLYKLKIALQTRSAYFFNLLSNFVAFGLLGFLAVYLSLTYSFFIIPVLLFPVTNRILHSEMLIKLNGQIGSSWEIVIWQILCMGLSIVITRWLINSVFSN